ncbi:MAG: hypothetical protein QGI06_09745 [Rhodospirillales bacterium]|nr:hypothetical protein [Rhodospirillales bacterium]
MFSMLGRYAGIDLRLDGQRNLERSPLAVRLAWAGAIQVCTPRRKARRAPGGGRSVLLGLLLAMILGSAWTASAWGEETQLSCLGCGGAGKQASDDWLNPLLERAKALRCVRLAKRSGREIVVNACGTCRIVKVSRKRPGSNPASSRTYTMARSSTMPLPFRGPGRTRLLGDQPCKGKDASPAEASDRQCVALRKNKTGKTVLVNGCEVCRKVSLERIHANGERTVQFYTIARNAYVPAPPRGARSARVLSDQNCR